jgi:ribosome-dependent ATPase
VLAATPGAPITGLPLGIEPRFIYNQEFRSIYAITPGVLMLTLILIPAMLTALGIVREKEIGSITNFYASPASGGPSCLASRRHTWRWRWSASACW